VVTNFFGALKNQCHLDTTEKMKNVLIAFVTLGIAAACYPSTQASYDDQHHEANHHYHQHHHGSEHDHGHPQSVAN
jgi:hypothetical protein